MRINFRFVTVLNSVCINIASAIQPPGPGPVGCNTNDLTKPEHWKEWDCRYSSITDSSNWVDGFVLVGTKCFLVCEPGYTPYSDRKKNYYTCRPGWKPNHLNLSCKYDPAYWIPILMNEIEDNRGNIDVHRDNIEQNAEHLQDYFKDTMNFDAIKFIEIEAYMVSSELPDGPLVVEINGNKGYVCNTDETVDQHTADLLCQKAGFPLGAYTFHTPWHHVPIEAQYIDNNLSLNLGDIHCPSTARTISECHSSGWGDFRNECDYNDVLWLYCNLVPPD